MLPRHLGLLRRSIPSQPPKRLHLMRSYIALPRMNFLRSLFSSPSTQPTPCPVPAEDPARYCEGGYHPVRLGDVYNGRYRVLRKLGFGLYSTVWLARDTSSARHVALKILTADSYGGAHPVFELDILRRVTAADPQHPGYAHVARLLDDFKLAGPHGEHLCLVFDVLGESVAAFRRRLPSRQIPARLVGQIGRQMFSGLHYLHQTCGVIHTDLKPQNILIELDDAEAAIQSHLQLHPSPSRKPPYEMLSESLAATDHSVDSIKIRIVDFGVASWVDRHLTEHITPADLRPPEVVLGVPWDTKVDVWTAVCVIFELLQGYLLFGAKASKKGTWSAEDSLLATMIELLGPLPMDLVKQGKKSTKFFDDEGQLRNIHQLYPISWERKINVKRNPDLSDDDVAQFAAFLAAMLKYRPAERPTAAVASNAPWLRLISQDK